ncbi:MAG: lactate dehydrogenase [Acidobacteria bacterium]|jgi:D-3-phosphoglycerate dehydrogenase|nr:lactate dehydrogenase [Acidobacteriota bacterium]|tara:strand:+ start:3717 stop:4682 length:966 start_codon:yes stop_codon:yes gene_type:complete
MATDRVLITPTPFAKFDERPIELLTELGVDYVTNPLGVKPNEEQMVELVDGVDIIIAGTEPITDRVMANAPRLRLISRVGVGLDNIDLEAARRRSITISHTPLAPVPAVAEMTLALMLVLLRGLHVSNTRMHEGQWHRIIGRRITDVTIGIVGTGHIGRAVLKDLGALGAAEVLLHDSNVCSHLSESVEGLEVKWVSLDELLTNSDVVTLHLPLTESTRNLIALRELTRMKKDSVLINTSRGGIVNEDDLFSVLAQGHLAGAGVDVFEKEPYSGPLATIERCLLTSHMGSASTDCRARMELGATEEVVRFLTGQPLMFPVA